MVVSVDDAVLLAAARAGDADAFAVLVRRHERQVYRVALGMMGSEHDAQDAAQETFVRAWRSLGSFRGDSSVATWLYRIVTNRCLSMLAAGRGGAAAAATNGGRLEAIASGGEDPAAVVQRRARMEAVSRAVAGLPADQRAALVLRDYEGLSYAEVGEVLGIRVGAVKSRIHRARAEVLKRTLGWR